MVAGSGGHENAARAYMNIYVRCSRDRWLEHHSMNLKEEQPKIEDLHQRLWDLVFDAALRMLFVGVVARELLRQEIG